MKIIDSPKTPQKYIKRYSKKQGLHNNTRVIPRNKNWISVQHASKVLGIIITGAVVLGKLSKKDADNNGIPDITESMTDYFSKYQYKDMSNFNPIKPIVIWANTNKELMSYYKQEHIYDQEIKNTMRHIVALAHTTQEYKHPAIARSIGYCKEIMDACKFDFDKEDWGNNEVGIVYVMDNPNCSKHDILEYAYQYAQKSKLLSNKE